MLAAALAAAGSSAAQEWWDAVPAVWKWGALAVAVLLLAVGVVRKILVLAVAAGLVAAVLLGYSWWVARH